MRQYVQCENFCQDIGSSSRYTDHHQPPPAEWRAGEGCWSSPSSQNNQNPGAAPPAHGAGSHTTRSSGQPSLRTARAEVTHSNSLEIAALITDQWPRSEENKYLSSREPTCGTETGFTGRRRTEKASIILMILFSFEVDTLEISLREIQDVVDHIFIVESSITHRGVF